VVPVESAPPRRRWWRRGEPDDRALTNATVPAIFLPKSTGGEPVTERNALNLVDVWACVRVLSWTAATLMLHAFRRTEQGRERVVAERLQEPAPGLTKGTFVAWAVASLALHGEALIGKYRGDGGEVRMIGLLDPTLVGMEVGPDGEPIYSYVNADGEPVVLFRQDVIHARLMTLDGLRGVSPIRQCRDALVLSASLSKHASESASGGYRPDGVVTVREGPGAEDVAENLRKRWSERHSQPGNA
jgi:HK97 family phage portal protein